MVETFRSPLAGDAHAGAVALITGGGTGIGRAIAREFVRTGARVAICGRRPEPLAAVQEELGVACWSTPCDVRDPEQLRAFLDAVGERFERVDVLVNNAGGQFPAPLEQTPLKGMRAVHRLNVDAVWDLTHEVANRWMIPQRSGFVAFLGFSPRRGVPLMVHSSMARSALETFAAGIALEWSRFNIRAVCVSCGLIETEGLMGYGGPELLAHYEAQVPMKRAGSAEEVAATITFLASAGAGYVTGTTVVVDGGTDAWGLGELPPDLEPPGVPSTTPPA
jgi:citronellol/citronellal dehydrogenase